MRRLAVAFFTGALFFSVATFAQTERFSAQPISKRATQEKSGTAAPVKTVSKTPPKESGVGASIRTDGAMVYSSPDFDSELLTTLQEGTKVRVSNGTTGDVAKFHKIRTGPILGYIAEIDVQIDGAVKKREHKRGAGTRNKSDKKSAKGAKRDSGKSAAKKPREKLPFLFTRYVGLLLGTAAYKDSLGGREETDSLLTYGLKITGPDILFQGPILDFNLALHYGPPQIYTDSSITKAQGFLLLGDVLLLVPLLHKDAFLTTFGLGPLVSYRSFRTTDSTGFNAFTGFNFGLSTALGAGYRFGEYAVRFEGKYLLDKRLEHIFQLSLQNEF